MKKIAYYGMMLFVCGMFLGVVVSVSAEDLIFPETAEEIVDALRLDTSEQHPIKGKGGLKSTGKNDTSLFDDAESGDGLRGLESIVEDEETLDKLPKVGALILFEFDSTTIKDESFRLLQEYGKALQGELKDAVLIIAGHTDSSGDDDYNFDLSQRRAKAIKDFLVTKFEISEEQLMIKPYGEKKPMMSNLTPEGRAKNRRVEFIRIQ